MVGWGNLLCGSLSTSEHQNTTDHYGENANDRCHHATLLRSDLERADLYFVVTLRVRYSLHRDDDDAANDEKHANPGEWPHDVSGKRDHECCVMPGCRARQLTAAGIRI